MLLLSMVLSGRSAVVPRLVQDFNQEPVSGRSQIQKMTVLGDTVFFTAQNRLQGNELWKSDGTPEGTMIVKDINPRGDQSSNPFGFTAFQDELYFSANDGVHGHELWKTDGTKNGTVMVAELSPGEYGSTPRLFAVLDDVLFFIAYHSSEGPALWKSDGSEEGTTRVIRLQSPDGLTVVGDKLYFQASTAKHGWELWVSDGTAEGTELALDFVEGPESLFLRGLTALGDKIFFSAATGDYGFEPWVWNTATGVCQRLKDIATDPIDAIDEEGFFPFQGQLFFSGLDVELGGFNLYVTDGSPGSTRLFKVLPLGGLNPGNFIQWNDQMVFQANRSELWTTDGTKAGTMKIVSLPGNLAYLTPSVLVEDTLYMTVGTTDAGWELWKTNGSQEGTHLVKDIAPGPDSSNPDMLSAISGRLVFQANDHIHGSELWASEGVEESTRMIQDIVSGTESSDPNIHASLGDLVFFSKEEEYDDRQQWVTDGTTEGLRSLPGAQEGTEPRQFEIFAGKAFYLNSSCCDKTLWVTHGPPLRTEKFDFMDARGRFVFFNGALYCSGSDFWPNHELYRSQGTTRNSMTKVAEINPDGSSSPWLLAEVNEVLLLSAREPTHGRELWRTDGTEAGTVLVKDIHAGTEDAFSSDTDFAVADNLLFFQATDGVHGEELWRSDGTTAGTMLVKDLNVSGDGSPQQFTAINGQVFFTADNGAHGNELWLTDGTEAHTTLVVDLLPGAGGSDPEALVKMNGILYFVATDGIHGQELWRSDGTPHGTFLVKDIWEGSVGSDITALVVEGSTLYFAANDGVHGEELWRSDGTTSGTQLVADLNPGIVSSMPRSILQAGTTVYFTAATEEFGREIFAFDTATNLPAPFLTWIGQTPQLLHGEAGLWADPNKDGCINALAYLSGSSHALESSTHLLPDYDIVMENEVKYFSFSFRRLADSEGLSCLVETTTDFVEYTEAVHGVGGVIIDEHPDYFGEGLSKVTAKIPRGEEAMMLGRLRLRNTVE